MSDFMGWFLFEGYRPGTAVRAGRENGFTGCLSRAKRTKSPRGRTLGFGGEETDRRGVQCARRAAVPGVILPDGGGVWRAGRVIAA